MALIRYKTGLAALLVALLTALPVHSARVYVSGRVTDENGQAVELATVNDETTMQSAVTGLKGYYSMIVTPPDDTLRLVFRMLGHETRRMETVITQDSMRINMMLPTLNYNLKNVDISATRRQTGAMQELSASDIRFQADASGGQVESMIAMQAGVSSHNELSSQYSVRGGNFDENSVYVNGTEILRPQLIRSGQQEGLSFINPDMTESIRFSTGGFGVEYADRMASVLDITYRRPKGFESALQGSLLGASAYVGYGTDKFSASGSIRYKQTSSLLGTLDTDAEYNPSFLDCQTFLSWTPNEKWDLSFTGNAALNSYRFSPYDRMTSFGTDSEQHTFKVFYEGWEKDIFNTLFGALDIKRKAGRWNLRMNASVFDSRESESSDILSQYWLDEEKTDADMAIGSSWQHVRNRLHTSVFTMSLKGETVSDAIGRVAWGVEYRHQDIDDSSREWEMRDSAGYTLPYSDNAPFRLYSTLLGDNRMKSDRVSAFIQDTYRMNLPVGLLSLNFGVRSSWWSWNGKTTFSPRLTCGLQPSFSDDLTFRLSAGIYHQAPFYKELKQRVCTGGADCVSLNSDILSQRSSQIVLGGDYDFQVFDRPFKFTAELYFKYIDRLIPYVYDNVRIVYSGKNESHGYATGLDMKLFGEFTEGTQSWLTFSLMNARQNLRGRWQPLPTDQLYNLSLYFSDTFPRRDRWKMSLRCSLTDGLPFSSPSRQDMVFRASAYKRIDIGLAYKVLDGGRLTHVYGRSPLFDQIWIGADCLNLIDANNVNSYYWISDISGTQFAVPNYLTGRQLNIRISASLSRLR